jgi:hypothetical protein
MFLTLLTLLPLLVPTLAAPQPNADPECLFCGGMQGHASTSTDTIFYDKYSTASGFSQFTSEIVRTGVKYLRTQTYDSDLEWFTVTDSASFASAAATNQNLISLTKEFFNAVFNYIVTETVLPTDVKAAVQDDYDALWETDGGTVTTKRSSVAPKETAELSPVGSTVPTTEQGPPTVLVTQTISQTPSLPVALNAGLQRVNMLSVLGLLVGMVVAVGWVP